MREQVELDKKEPCGCGSGQPYGRCCRRKKRVQYLRDGRGRIHKQVALDADGRAAMEKARAAFKDTFGRAPKARDRVLLAPYRYSRADFRKQFVEIADKANAPKHLVYAYLKTDGLMLTETNKDLVSPQDIADVNDAVEEYFAAQDIGIDLLKPEMTPRRAVLSIAKDFFEDAIVALGSIADRSPRSVARDQPLFFQFLLISQCHQAFKSFSERWDDATSRELIATLRGLYECALLISRLEREKAYSETLLAQALAGTEIYAFRKTRSGRIDYTRLVERDSGREFEARTSFRACAIKAGPRHLNLFDILYPLQSSYVHFNSLGVIQKYRELGSFLMWDERDEVRDAALALVVLTYCLHVIRESAGLTRQLRRDSNFF